MKYVGIDIHLRTTAVCILDEHGQRIRNYTINGGWNKVLEEVARIEKPFAVCYEASSGYGYLYEKFCRYADRVVVGHPGHLRLIFHSKNKHDRIDAEKLAKLLYLDAVPGVYVPSVAVRDWRGLITYRTKMIAERTRIKNTLRSLMRGNGHPMPKRAWSRDGLAWIRAQELPTAMAALQRDMLLERLEEGKARIKRLESVLNRQGRAHPGVTVLRTIPGVGARTAEGVVAYMDRPERFHSSKAVGCYFGFVPSQDSSGGRDRLGHITREGPSVVRGLLTEAAWQGIRKSTRLRSFYERVCRGDPDRKKIAVVATAHYLLRVMHAMLRTGEVWRAETEENR
jgi:transposase